MPCRSSASGGSGSSRSIGCSRWSVTMVFRGRRSKAATHSSSSQDPDRRGRRHPREAAMELPRRAGATLRDTSAAAERAVVVLPLPVRETPGRSGDAHRGRAPADPYDQARGHRPRKVRAAPRSRGPTTSGSSVRSKEAGERSPSVGSSPWKTSAAVKPGALRSGPGAPRQRGGTQSPWR